MSESSLHRFVPSIATLVLIAFLGVFFVLGGFGAWKGFVYIFFTLMLAIGLQPHIDQLSEEGHRLNFALNWRGKRHEWSPRFYIANKKWANRLVCGGLIVLSFLILPLIALIMYHQAIVFAERVETHREVLEGNLNTLIRWARDVAPAYVPQGDASATASGVAVEVFGDAKKTMMKLASFLSKVAGIAVYDWFKIIVAVIILYVTIENYKKESAAVRGIVSRGISNETYRKRTLRFMEIYQESLSTLIIGFLEVGLTLSVYYFLAMLVLPLKLSLGALLLFALIFGFITAIWKIGGIFTKILAPLFMVFNFQAGFGWLGYEIFSLGIWLDIAIKASLMFCIAFIGGALEAYNYTPEKIGVRLGLTKMMMVSIIVIMAVGWGASGMIWGVLALLVFQSLEQLRIEEEENEGDGAGGHVGVTG